MDSRMRMLDIYSGLGGASEAFLKAGWEVHRLENNVLLKDVPGTKMVDVLKWPFQEIPIGYYDFIWASPPCREFSNGYAAPAPKAKRAGREFQPNLDCLKRAKEIIDYLQPKYWAIENVAGASRIFSKELGVNAPRQIIGSFYVWGVFPFVVMDNDFKHTKESVDTWSTDPLRANKKGKVPIEISTGFLESITCQRQITEWVV